MENVKAGNTVLINSRAYSRGSISFVAKVYEVDEPDRDGFWIGTDKGMEYYYLRECVKILEFKDYYMLCNTAALCK